MKLTKGKNGNGGRGLFPSLINDFFGNRMLGPNLVDMDDFDAGLRLPPANISETNTEFHIDLSAPGLKRDDFKVEVENGDLVVSCEKKEEDKEDKENYWRREFSYTSFCRRFPLPDNTLDEKINAKYDNGMLHIIIPKKETTVTKPKKAIQVA